jgi:hypothetical protein
VAERVNKMSAAAGGTYYTFLSFCLLASSFILADVFLSLPFAVSLVLQNILKYLRGLCNPMTILS